ncbi:hypothetical protein NEIPOLOT_02004 [Neisseria polysaccharea ATCC 43768]|nr:hypothetical protein NEIPOLOT_02004 [Neisseria polysaccharea ATCC 43768]
MLSYAFLCYQNGFRRHREECRLKGMGRRGIIRLFVFSVNFDGKFIRIYQVFACLGYNAAV